MHRGLSSHYRITGNYQALDFHTHTQYEIYFFHQGHCRFMIGDQLYTLQPGDLLLIDGMTVHRAAVLSEEPAYIRSVIHFDRDWLEPLLDQLNITYLLQLFTENKNGLIRILREEATEKIEQSFKTLAEYTSPDDAYTNEAKRKLSLCQLLLHIEETTNQVIKKPMQKGDEKTKIAEDVSAYIFKHYQESLTIETIASDLNLSKSYLSHVFKEISGQTIMSFLMGYRLSQATMALHLDPNKTIKQISSDCGFESDAHFSRYFKQQLGMTPSNFRKQNFNKEENVYE